MYIFANLRQSRELIQACYALLRADRELMLYPVVSLVTMAVLIAVLLILAPAGDALCVIVFVLALLPLFFYYVTFYFQVALAGAILIRLEGGDPAFFDGFRIAQRRSDVIFRFTLYVALMKAAYLFFAMLSRQHISTQTAETHGLRWGTATFLIIPVLATGSDGVDASIEQSATLVKQTWGETVFAHTGLGQFFFVMSLLVGLVLATLLYITASAPASLDVVLVTLGAAYFVIIETISATLSTVYAAVLYRYTQTGTVPSNFDIEKVKVAFKFASQAELDRHLLRKGQNHEH